MADLPMTYQEAVALVKEIGESLGGRQKLAIDKVLTYAARGVRPSSMKMEAVREAAFGAQHFVKAQHELDKGALEAKLRIDDAVGRAKAHIGEGLVAVGHAAKEVRELAMIEINEVEQETEKK